MKKARTNFQIYLARRISVSAATKITTLYPLPTEIPMGTAEGLSVATGMEKTRTEICNFP